MIEVFLEKNLNIIHIIWFQGTRISLRKYAIWSVKSAAGIFRHMFAGKELQMNIRRQMNGLGRVPRFCLLAPEVAIERLYRWYEQHEEQIDLYRLLY